ncbi:putative ribonuclease H-like domain-containing protein [Tanacetum coccineum]
MVVFYFCLLKLHLTIVVHDLFFQLSAPKLWPANTSFVNYSCRGKIYVVAGFDKPSDTLVLVTDFVFEKLFLPRESEKGVGFPKTDGFGIMRAFGCRKVDGLSNLVSTVFVGIRRLLSAVEVNAATKQDLFKWDQQLRTTKQLEEILNFKQEGDETLYQAWEQYNDLLYKCPTHDINNHQKVNIFYNGLGAINRQLLDSQRLIPDMTHVQALTAIQTMADPHPKSGMMGHPVEVLKEEVKSIEEAKFGEFRRPSLFSNGAKYRVGPPGYYTRIDNCPQVGEKRPSLEELMNKLQENAEINTRNQAASLKNLETQIEQLTKEFHTKAANEINSPSLD